MKHKARQLEVKWGEPEAFALVIEKSLGGERIAREEERKEQDKQHAEKQQKELI